MIPLPYSETHTITIGPLTLAAGIDVQVAHGVDANGNTVPVVTITGSTATSKADTASLLHDAFAQLMTAATAEGVGTPVFS